MKKYNYSYSKDPQQVNQLIFERPLHNVGGVDCIIVGKPGCGKTTAMVQIAINNQKKFKDVVLVRGSDDCQWSYFLNADIPMDLIVKRGVEIDLFNRRTGKRLDPDNIFHKVKEYVSAKNLVESRLSQTRMNVIQTTPYTSTNPNQHLQFCVDWLQIYEALNQRKWNHPVTVCFDEFEDLVAEGVGKKLYDIELSLSGIFRKNRKNGISSFIACHSLADVHWRIKKKMRWKMYMRGAKQSKDSMIKKTLSDLPVGTCYLEGDKFERFEFKPMGNEFKIRAAINTISQI